MVNSATTPPPEPPEKVGVIDLGSNSVLLLVLGRGGRILFEEAHITRLSEGLFETGTLQSAAIARTLSVISGLVDRARRAGAERVVTVATEVLRCAPEAAEIERRLLEEGGVDAVRVLSGLEEARFTIESSRRAIADAGDPLGVIDVGGGSTEIAWAPDGTTVRGMSLPLGSVRLTERLVAGDPPDPGELAAVRAAVRQELGRPAARAALRETRSLPIVAVAGTATTLAALDQRLRRYDAAAVEGYEMTLREAEAWVADLATRTIEERRALPGMDPGRADVIVAGLLILLEVIRAIEVDGFRISGRGVRHGVALRMLEDPQSVW